MPTAWVDILSLHDALPISIFGAGGGRELPSALVLEQAAKRFGSEAGRRVWQRSEEHTSELQSHSDLVCRLLLEKKKIRIGLLQDHFEMLPSVVDVDLLVARNLLEIAHAVKAYC